MAGIVSALAAPPLRAEQTLGVIRVGVVGLDAHAATWVRLVNGPAAAGLVKTMRIVAGVPAGSPDIPQSQELLKKGVAAFKQMKVDLVDAPEQLWVRVDAVMVLSIDGRPHWSQARQAIMAGKPVFVDKPMAASVADAIRIFELAERRHVPCFSSSCLRFSPHTQQVVSDPAVGKVLGCEAHSPCAIEPHHPDLFWYGIHGVETLFTIMGTGCRSVQRVTTTDTDLAIGVWDDGRIGTFRGHRQGPHTYGATVFGSKQVVHAGEFEGYEPLLAEIARFFRSGRPPVRAEQTLEILAFMKAADRSRQQNGRPVRLADVLAEARRQVEEKKE